MRRRKKTGGFSLLEVLIALGILAMGSTCVVALYSAAMETFRRSQVEFVVTHAAVEMLDTAEDLLMHGTAPERLQAEVKKRVSVPPRYSFDLTPKEENGCVLLTLRLMTGGDEALKTWTWKREVVRGAGDRILALPQTVPKRYN